MKEKSVIEMWMRRAVCAGGILAACVTCGDTAFTAGEWDVAFVMNGAALKLTHRPSGIEVRGKLSFKGPDKATDAAADPKSDWIKRHETKLAAIAKGNVGKVVFIGDTMT